MLPFLKNKNASVAGLIIKNRKPDDVNPEEMQADSPDMDIESAAQDLISAIEMKDSKALVSALKAVIDLMDQAPIEPEMSEEEI